MKKSIRQTTLQTIGPGSVKEIFRNGKLPVDTDEPYTHAGVGMFMFFQDEE